MDILSVDPGHLQAYYEFDQPSNYIEFQSPVKDNFNRANGAVDPAVWQARLNRPMQIQSNQLVAAASTGAASYGVYLPGGVLTDAEAYATVGYGGTAYPGAYAGVCVRLQPGVAGDTPRGYAATLWVGNTAASGAQYGLLVQRLGSPNVTIGGYTSSPPDVFPGDKIGLVAQGNTINVWIYRMATGQWRLQQRITDNTYTSGYCGVMGDPTVTLDDFGCGAPTISHALVWPFPGTSGQNWIKYDFLKDYSGHNRNLMAVQEANVSFGTNPPTFDGNTVQFNLGYFIWVGPFSANRQGLIAPYSFGEFSSSYSQAYGIPTGTTQSFMIKWIPTAPPDGWAPYNPATDGYPSQPCLSTRYRSFGATTNEGFAYWLNPGTGALVYTVATNQGFPSGAWTLPNLVANRWTWVVMRLTPPNPMTGYAGFPSATDIWTREFFYDGESVLKIQDIGSVVSPIPGGGDNLSFGSGNEDDLRWCAVRCAFDHFAVWDRPEDLFAPGIEVSFTENTHDQPSWTRVDDPVVVGVE